MSFSRRGNARILVALCVVALSLFCGASYAQAQGNGALYFSPSSGQHQVGATFLVSVRMSTGGDAVNAAEGSVMFDAGKLEVVSVSKAGSIFTLWPTEPTFSNSDGTVRFTGGLPSPGYSGSSGQIITINFRARTATTLKGYTDVILVSGAMLANDGSGTNILESLGKATFYLAPGIVQPTPPSGTPTATIGTPNIRSSTHPDPSKWYNNSNPIFDWEVPAGVSEVRLVLAENSNSAPRVRYSPPISQKALTDVADGTWYLRAQFITAQGVGQIGTLKFNVDTHPPQSFSVSRVDTSDATNPQPQILFSTTDTASGVDHYELQVGDDAWLIIQKQDTGKAYTLPLQVPGTRSVTVKAIDGAGNTATAMLSLTVASITAPTITEFPSEAQRGTPITLSGRGTPGTRILISVDATQVGQGDVDTNGDWYVQTDPMHAGTFAFSARAQDSRGALSDASDSVTISVRGNFFMDILNFIARFFTGIFQPGTWWFAISLIFYISVVSALLHLLWRLVRWLQVLVARRAATRRCLSRGELALIRKLRGMDGDIKKELALLKQVAKHRPLYPEEKYLVSKLNKYLKVLRSLGMGK